MTEKGDAMMKTIYQAQKTITVHFFKQMKLIPVLESHKRNFRKLRESTVPSRGKYTEKKQADYALQGQQKPAQEK